MNSPSKKTWRNLIVNLSLLIAALAVSLLICEFIVRTFYPQRLYYNVSQWDPYVGFTLVPNAEGISIHQDYTMHMKINSKGLRDREFSYVKPPNTIRIGVFGDSFTFGEGVQNNEAYPKVLESLLNGNEKIGKTGGHVEVLNFGLGKTGTSHQLAWYQKEGRKYHLDFVILGFLAANDFTDNWSGVFYLENDKLVHNPQAYTSLRRIQKIVQSIPFYRWLAVNSQLFNLLKQIVAVIDDKVRFETSANSVNSAISNKRELEAKEYYLTLRLIKEFQKEVLENGSRFMVVNLASKNQKLLSDYSEQDQIKEYVKRGEALVNELARTDVRLLNLVPVFSNLPISKCYFKHDGHMTKYGHQVVARKIYDVILPDVYRLLLRKTADEGRQGGAGILTTENQVRSK